MLTHTMTKNDSTSPQIDASHGVAVQRHVRPWDDVCHDPKATTLERETALLVEWNKTLTELRRLESEVAATLNENAHLADGDNCTLIRLKRAIGWANITEQQPAPPQNDDN